MTSMISDYPKSIPPVVANFGWYYGTQPLASRATIPQTNLVPNPSFEYDTVGSTSPAGWISTGGTSGTSMSLQVQNGWANSGSQSLRITASTTPADYYTLGVVTPVMSVISNQTYSWSMRFNILANNGAVLGGFSYGNTGFTTGYTTTSFTGTGTLSMSTIIPPGETRLQLFVGFDSINIPNTFMDGYFDSISMIHKTDTTYHDGDSPGWAWSGAPGNSTSIDQKDDFVTPLNQIITFDAIDQQGLGMPHTITPSGVSIVDYKWDFGNGQVAHGPFASTTYNYSKPPPDMQVSLTVTDSHGRMYSCAHRLNLQALTPTYATTLRERG